jgi:hypothetical protein
MQSTCQRSPLSVTWEHLIFTRRHFHVAVILYELETENCAR